MEGGRGIARLDGHAGDGREGVGPGHGGHGEMERGRRGQLAMLGEELLTGVVGGVGGVRRLVHGGGRAASASGAGSVGRAGDDERRQRAQTRICLLTARLSQY